MTFGKVTELDHKGLVESIGAMGINAGDTVLIHSSLKGIGHLSGGVEDVVKAFQEVLTADGTMIMPTYAYCYNGEVFNVNESPSKTGLLTEVFRTMPGVYRSWHPTHSMSAWGKHAEYVCKDHEKVEPYGLESPLHKFLSLDGKVFLLGVLHDSSSIIHLTEKLAGLPYLHLGNAHHKPAFEVMTPVEELITVKVREFPGHSIIFNVVEKDLRLNDQIRDFKLGGKNVLVYKARHVVDISLEMLRKNPDIFLCNSPDCYICSRRRVVLNEKQSCLSR